MFSSPMIEIALGFAVAAVIATWGFWRGFLTRGGAVAACLVGGCVWAGGSWGLAVPLVFFFVASSLVTRWSIRWRSPRRPPRRTPRDDQNGTGGADVDICRPQTRISVARDFRQVGANGVVAAVCAVIGSVSGDGRWLYAALCCLTAMTGDTWSSEIGRALIARPFDLRTLRRVEAGISGAVSSIGSLAGLVGVFCTALIGTLLLPGINLRLGHPLLVLTVWAFAAVWVDSAIGATVQERYICETCGKITDDQCHCGKPARWIAGLPGIDNNAVNLLTTIFAAGIILFL